MLIRKPFKWPSKYALAGGRPTKSHLARRLTSAHYFHTPESGITREGIQRSETACQTVPNQTHTPPASAVHSTWHRPGKRAILTGDVDGVPIAGALLNATLAGAQPRRAGQGFLRTEYSPFPNHLTNVMDRKASRRTAAPPPRLPAARRPEPEPWAYSVHKLPPCPPARLPACPPARLPACPPTLTAASRQ